MTIEIEIYIDKELRCNYLSLESYIPSSLGKYSCPLGEEGPLLDTKDGGPLHI